MGNNSLPSNSDTITIGGGCFWCVEAIYEDIRGVLTVESGYSGGINANPTYKEVCNGMTGHAEVTQIVFDPTVVSLDDIFRVFFGTHDPTTLNRQGADVGTQYRSVVFYRNEAQKLSAKKIITEAQSWWDDPIVTELSPFSVFYKAENYHQNYYQLNQEQPYCKAVINPKLLKFRKKFSGLMKENH
ncbi:MAG: peptide-methionine (S)-S-oxide reductase MsrA [Bacteroidota bacterium]